MKQKRTKALLLLLMAMISITTAYADEQDMGTWSENTGFGQNGADLTTDGYSLWDGWSFQNYELRTSGEQQGIHIANAAQLARYAYDMYNYNNSYWSDRRTRDVYLECDIDLNNKYFSITRSSYYIENATFYGQGHVIRNGYGIATGGRCALFSDIRGERRYATWLSSTITCSVPTSATAAFSAAMQKKHRVEAPFIFPLSATAA